MNDAFEALRAAVAKVDEEATKLYDAGALDNFADIPEDIRDRLLTLGSSVNDYVFWVRPRRQADDGDDRSSWIYHALEVESGCGAWGVTAREALDNYFRDDVLDYRGVS